MARIFLSYHRDDAARARSIALVLEKAGHSVWWDRHIRGGAQYSLEIEQALKAADVVVVLWSPRSVESPWVRDEAAAGRDRGRLVPLTLDGTEAPLGFRQFQTIDLGGWKGRGTIPRLPELLQSIDGVLGDEGSRPRAEQVRPSIPSPLQMPRSGRLAIVAVLAFAAIAVTYFLVNRGKSDVHTVAITAADRSSGPLARDLLRNLGNMQYVQAGSVQLLGEVEGDRPDLIFEAQAAAKNGGANLALVGGKDGAILWSGEFRQGPGTPADLKLQMAYTAGRVLGCAIEGLEPGAKPLRANTLKLYLTGCSQFAEGDDEARESVIPVFAEVVSKAPRFKAAWAKLVIAESDAVEQDSNRNRRILQRYIAQARQLDPQMPEATLAEVMLLPTKAFGESLRLLDRAKERHPGNAMVLGHRSMALSNVGRLTDAIEDAREAARLEPTSPDTFDNYVRVLAYSGRTEAARAELQRAERLWPGTGRLRELQYAFLLRFGDPKELLNTDEFKRANPRMQLYYRTRANPTPANIDRFMAFLKGLYSRRGLTADDIVGHSQPYGEFGREEDLFELIFRLPASEDLSALAKVIFRPALRKFRQDPRFMIVAQRIGLVDYWTKSGDWPDFCFDPDQPYDCKVEAAKLS